MSPSRSTSEATIQTLRQGRAAVTLRRGGSVVALGGPAKRAVVSTTARKVRPAAPIKWSVADMVVEAAWKGVQCEERRMRAERLHNDPKAVLPEESPALLFGQARPRLIMRGNAWATRASRWPQGWA